MDSLNDDQKTSMYIYAMNDIHSLKDQNIERNMGSGNGVHTGANGSMLGIDGGGGDD